MIQTFKWLPLDLGQDTRRATTEGKQIARRRVPDAAPGQRALDVGCREGIQSEWLMSKGYAVTSVDLHKSYDRCVIVDVDRPLPFVSETFDLVWCSEVIEHLRDPVSAIDELTRVLRPGGLLLVTTPNSRCWFYRMLSWFGVTPAKAQNPDHKHFFSEADIRRMFPSAEVLGFFPYTLVKRTIRRGLDLWTPTFVVAQRKRARY